MNLQELDDWVAETTESIAARLDAAKAIQRQTQFTLGMMALVSMTMLIVSYNAYLSYDSGWILARVDRSLTRDKALATVSELLTERALSDWADSRNVQISLLGIHVSVDDSPILGTSTLFVLSLWLLLLMRRENHTIGFLLRDTDTPSQDTEPGSMDHEHYVSPQRQPRSSGERWLIFHTIIANNLFITFDRSLTRVRYLRGPTPLNVRQKGRAALIPRLALGFVRRFFFWFPAVTSGVVFYLDRRSYFQPDPFLPGATTPGASAPFFYQSAFVFLACWIPLLVCTWKTSQYIGATENVLHEYGTKLRSDLVRQQRTIA